MQALFKPSSCLDGVTEFIDHCRNLKKFVEIYFIHIFNQSIFFNILVEAYLENNNIMNLLDNIC